MADIINFPSREKQLDKLVRDLIQEGTHGNPELAKCYEEAATQVRQILKELNSSPYAFTFDPKNDSIRDNLDLISESVNKMGEYYWQIISNLLGLLFKEKANTCNLLHK